MLCWHVAIVWPRLYISTQHIASLLRAFGYPVATCCDMLAGCRWLKFKNGQIFHATFMDVVWCCCRLARFKQQCCAWACALVWFSTRNMSQHVTTGWSNARDMLRSVGFKCWDRLAEAYKWWANNVGICCVEMLLSFGRGLVENTMTPVWDVLIGI